MNTITYNRMYKCLCSTSQALTENSSLQIAALKEEKDEEIADLGVEIADLTAGIQWLH